MASNFIAALKCGKYDSWYNPFITTEHWTKDNAVSPACGVLTACVLGGVLWQKQVQEGRSGIHQAVLHLTGGRTERQDTSGW